MFANHRTIRCLTRTGLVLSFSLCINGSNATHAESVPEKVRFNRDVRPVLSDKCFACHGPDAQTVEGGLRLDVRELAVDDSGAIIAGDANASELIARIMTDDQDLVMPPAHSHKTLSAAERQVLKDWIDQGAVYEQHWAYEPMRSEGLDEADSLTAAIDHKIDARLSEDGLDAAPKADPVTLIRRLSFDLTGLPPESHDVDRFVNNPSERVYSQLVDQYLNSPRFGERMAIYWLDLVRYADTVGYHGDQNVSQSPYRDYVIKAFNDNKPYDVFVREQLAGDLLSPPNRDQPSQEMLVASGYNRLNQTTEEGGSQAKEYLAIYFADRVRNVSQVFLGSTMGCAQCHDHKYDPFTTKDFYALGAFFADLEERGVYGARDRPPMIPVPSEAEHKQLQRFDAQLIELEQQGETLRQQLLAEMPAWEAAERERADRPQIETDHLVVDQSPSDATLSGDWNFVETTFGAHVGSKVRHQQSDGLVQHYFEGLERPIVVKDQTTFFTWVYLDPKNPPQAIILQFNDGDWEQRKVWGSDAIEWGRRPESYAAYRRAGELPETGRWIRLEVAAQEIGLKPNATINGIAFTQFGGDAYWDHTGVEHHDGRSEAFLAALSTPSDQRDQSQTTRLQDAYFAESDIVAANSKSIEQAKADRASFESSITKTVISNSVEPRTIRILPRGNWMDDSGEIVLPAIPEFLGTLEVGDRRLTRLDLADWICQDDNPLTARTMANRMWKLMFGRGLCESVDDLGGQGTYPSYPDLLDTVSVGFVRSGWDVKQLLRSIVMSNAYQRSSTPSAEQVSADPYNTTFARQGRFCLDAEMVRDTALSVSGLLVEQVGGESVHPYQPPGYYAQLNFPRREYEADKDENQYRRGVYTHWQRTFLHPMLKAFDAPSREECTAARARSNTPLQALVLLNDPTFIEAARSFAERIMHEGGAEVDSKVDWAYKSAVSRAADPAIHQTLRHVFESNLERYRNDTQAASALLSQGNTASDGQLDAAELAAWTSVARVLLNLQETITRY
ncbi:PSD1 and planctomycete cytochrome C domain-containing protein [Rhodopirellula sp. MGV]|uniref:PSD1 and planctomycete cytochrome C domain-containing protein n=1 Tax=Rhodopirellula sp. MGV TaxID=2023130 RepID=UPI000B96242E|nr:PSD1 and planctomycete cytochrome C domain-containing protein [Rhodopirellula sp. MGV]OYP28211.1 peptidylprolyl isomerase [Rhodopirellula sp. MGV]PNY34393.1 DUF1553 domain-containing protein [Rhodopirellula baltica]